MTETTLLADLDSCRWLTMRALGDLAEEACNNRLAAGWRWLAHKRYWPSGTLYTEDCYYTWRRAGRNTDRDEGLIRAGVYDCFKEFVRSCVFSDAAALEQAWYSATQRPFYRPGQRDVTFYVSTRHYTARCVRHRPDDPLNQAGFFSWGSNNLAALMRDTALVVGDWLADMPPKKRKLELEATDQRGMQECA